MCANGLRGLRAAKQTLSDLGSVFAMHLMDSSTWVWIFIFGGKTLLESTIPHISENNYVQINVKLKDYKINSNKILTPLTDFCRKFGVVRELCDPTTKTFPSFDKSLKHNSFTVDIPIVITAGSRYQYLYHCLNSILKAPGGHERNIHVVLGHAPSATVELLQILGINFYHTNITGTNNVELFKYYHAVYKFVAKKFQDHKAVIFLDEDVEISPDFFSYINQTLWVLEEDPTVYCINGYSATGLQGFAHDPTNILRGQVQPEWGYVLQLSFIKEALSKWPINSNASLLYDAWIYYYVRKRRHCIFPEMSRTQHFGIGVNSDPWFTEHFYLLTPIVKESTVKLSNVSLLVKSSWHDHITKTISEAEPITKSPCSYNFFPPDQSKEKNYVFFYQQSRLSDGKPDYNDFYYAAKCLGIWSMSEQGQYETVSTIRFSKHGTLYMVGVPFSPFAYICPKNITVWTVDSNTEEQESIMMDIIQTNEIGKIGYISTSKKIKSENLMEDLFNNG